ncbi:MAG: fumarylacetoacetate hydrolase family protein [Dongiaceae bacterium]
MDYLFPAPPPMAVPILGSEAVFPVRRVFCVGRNYAAHAKEMGASGREAPFFFMKPNDALVINGGIVPYPPATNDLHYETELVLALNDNKKLFGYAVGLDLTRRDLQNAAKKQGHPWDMAKGFDYAAPIGTIAPKERVHHIEEAELQLQVNGVPKQRGKVADMIWKIDEIISELSKLIQLKAGDLIFTGTPDGVGPVRPGDQLRAGITGLPELAVEIK